VEFKLGPLPIALPNTSERVRAVRYHDLHHVLTGYHTDNVGEFEIAAWEIAAGCKDFWVAWLLNLAGLAGGCLVAPKRTFAAFVRGRACRSLYGEDLERLLDQTVGALREETGLDDADEVVPSLRDRLSFAALAALGFGTGVALLVVTLPLTPFVLLFSGVTALGMRVQS
jgi:hypothetical protein